MIFTSSFDNPKIKKNVCKENCTHLCIDPVTVHPTSKHSLKYDGQSNNMTRP